MSNKLLNVKQVAEALSVAPKTVYMWRWKRKNLSFIKVGGSVKVSEKDLMDFIESRKIRPE
jgi:excisionase family DNA binding protein